MKERNTASLIGNQYIIAVMLAIFFSDPVSAMEAKHTGSGYSATFKCDGKELSTSGWSNFEDLKTELKRLCPEPKLIRKISVNDRSTTSSIDSAIERQAIQAFQEANICGSVEKIEDRDTGKDSPQ